MFPERTVCAGIRCALTHELTHARVALGIPAQSLPVVPVFRWLGVVAGKMRTPGARRQMETCANAAGAELTSAKRSDASAESMTRSV